VEFKAQTIWIQFAVAFGVSGLLLTVVFWSWHPPVGIYIGILALLGVCVPLIRGDKVGPREKALWTAVMFMLVLFEIKSIYQDRNEHDKQQAEARKEQLKGFETIGDGIQAAITKSDEQFAATMRSTDVLIANSRQNLDEIIGGTSYIVVTPILVPINGENEFRLGAHVIGEHRVSDARISLQDLPQPKVDPSQDFQNVVQGKKELVIFNGVVDPFSMQTLNRTILPSSAEVSSYGVSVYARNGSTMELLYVRFNSEMKRWEYSWMIGRVIRAKTKFTTKLINKQDWTVDVPFQIR
jgi:hypothetical protein